jgi:lipopolysaccharide biosynthesis glycosyltransferase
LSQKEISRWIKTSIKNYITGDFLFIDCDTVITGNLEFEFSPEIKIGAVLDTHVLLSEHHLTPYFQDREKKTGFNFFLKTEKYFNSGVIFCRDTPESEKLFSLWHSLWLIGIKNGIHQDQGALNQANSELGDIITELEGEWNCQITNNGLPYLYNAKIIHCFATSIKLYNCPYLPASIPFLLSVKETGIISDELMELLKNPKTAFEQKSRIISGDIELETINSKLFSLLLYLRKKKPGTFNIINTFLLKLRARTKK